MKLGVLGIIIATFFGTVCLGLAVFLLYNYHQFQMLCRSGLVECP